MLVTLLRKKTVGSWKSTDEMDGATKCTRKTACYKRRLSLHRSAMLILYDLATRVPKVLLERVEEYVPAVKIDLELLQRHLIVKCSLRAIDTGDGGCKFEMIQCKVEDPEEYLQSENEEDSEEEYLQPVKVEVPEDVYLQPVKVENADEDSFQSEKVGYSEEEYLQPVNIENPDDHLQEKYIQPERPVSSQGLLNADLESDIEDDFLGFGWEEIFGINIEEASLAIVWENSAASEYSNCMPLYVKQEGMDGDTCVQSEECEIKTVVKEEIILEDSELNWEAFKLKDNASLETEADNTDTLIMVSPEEVDSTELHYNTESSSENAPQSLVQDNRNMYNSLQVFSKMKMKGENLQRHSSSLRKHRKKFPSSRMMKFTRTEKKRCTMCRKSFSSDLKLAQHMNMHICSFTCPLCGDVFGCNGALKGHVRVHLGERPYHCKMCNKSRRRRHPKLSRT